ncbi:MAG: hypothetical protein AAF986_08790, partial [Pseudomonadota bacterium]
AKKVAHFGFSVGVTAPKIVYVLRHILDLPLSALIPLHRLYMTSIPAAPCVVRHFPSGYIFKDLSFNL